MDAGSQRRPRRPRRLRRLRPAPAIDAWAPVAIGVAVAALTVAAWAQRGGRGSGHDSVLAAALSPPDSEPEGLPAGTIAPGFALTDIHGGTQTLESLRAQGRPVVPQFVDSSCSPCRELLPTVARWQTALAERVTIAIVEQR